MRDNLKAQYNEVKSRQDALTFKDATNYVTEFELKKEAQELLDKYWEYETITKDIFEEIYNLELNLEVVDGIPDAPLKESLQTFLIKQAIKDAVEGGYDTIAWTTGTTSR